MEKIITNKLKYYTITILMLVFFLQNILIALNKSPIYDEPAHLARGFIYLNTGQMLILTHPPLAHILSAIPLLFIDVELPKEYEKYISINDPIALGQEIFYKANNNANIVFFWGRIPLIFLGIVLGIYIYRWAKELYGDIGGLFALFLYSFNPMILGNTSLIMTDITVTCFGFISVYYLWKFLSNKSIINLVLTAVTFALAQASKFTALFLIPIYLFFIIFSAYDFSIRVLFNEIIMKERLKTLLLMLGSFFLIGIITLSIINIFYGFEGFLIPNDKRIENDSGLYFDKEYFKSNSLAKRITDNGYFQNIISKSINYGASLFPYSYLKELVALIRMNNTKISTLTSGYLMGEYSSSSWWYYYPLAFLIKTPLPLIMLFLISILYKFSFNKKTELFLLIPLIVYPLYFIFHPTANGLRYLLPSYPFLFVFISRIANTKHYSNALKLPKPTFLIIFLLILYILESFLIFPNYTSYFNQFVGGSNNGYKYLAGTDLDVGQDLPLLKDYLKRNSIRDFKLAYYGTSDPYYYLNFSCLACSACPRYRQLQCPENCNITTGLIGVSASFIQNTPHMKNRNCFDWIKSYKPIEKVGYTIFIYNLSNQKFK